MNPASSIDCPVLFFTNIHLHYEQREHKGLCEDSGNSGLNIKYATNKLCHFRPIILKVCFTHFWTTKIVCKVLEVDENGLVYREQAVHLKNKIKNYSLIPYLKKNI